MGAPQSRILELCVALQSRGWQVCVVTAMPNYPSGKIFESYCRKGFLKEYINDIEVLRYTLYPSNSRKAIPRMLSMLSFSFTSLFSVFRVRTFNPNFIITESPPLTLAYTGLFLSFCSGSKHIMNVSDIWPLSALELGAINKGLLYNLLESMERCTYRQSFACMGQSDEILSHVENQGARRSILFRNGVDSTRFVPVQYTHRTKLRIVYMGLLGIAQGILELCRNMNFFELGYEFHVYGQGAERAELESLVVLEGELKSIFLHSPISRDKVPQELVNYDLTIIPLIKPIRGAVPSKIYEAMAAGLPILFAGGGEGAKIIQQHEVGWIVNPSDFDAMKSKLIEIHNLGPEQLKIIKEKARHTALYEFDRNLQVEKLNNFLQSELLS